MDGKDILQQFESINTWKKKGVRAPHKPLLMLLALGEIQRGNTGFIPYSTIEPEGIVLHLGVAKRLLELSIFRA